MKNQNHFSSRIGVRAVVAAMMVSTTTMILMLSFIAALGLWNFRISELADRGAGFWIASTLAWAASLYLGGFIASSGSRSNSTADGVMNALAACSGSYLLFVALLLFFSSDSLKDLLSNATSVLFLQIFFGELLGLVFGALGGISGARFEQHSEESFRKKIVI